jgi:hypothetical protein
MFPRIRGGKIWLPFTVETEDGSRGCGMYELTPEDPSYQETKEWLEQVERDDWCLFPIRQDDELDQEEVDRCMMIFPGLAMCASQNREERERGLQSVKKRLSEVDGMALDMARRVAFIKVRPRLLGYDSQPPEEGWNQVLDILNTEHKRIKDEWDNYRKEHPEHTVEWWWAQAQELRDYLESL